MSADIVSFLSLDGVRLAADLEMSPVDRPRATLVIGHPHPLHGGDRRNHVVLALREAAREAGLHSVAPDFRGAGGSEGEHDSGQSERLDLAAACALARDVSGDLPVVLAGYSFGAAVALNVSDPFVVGWLAVAPPLALLSPGVTASRDHRPKHLVVPRHDQFSAVEDLAAEIAGWTATTLDVAEGVDHFLAAAATATCSAALATLLAAAGVD